MPIRSFDDAVHDYIVRFRKDKLREERWFAIQSSADAAIERAATAVSPSGKRMHHQRRIPSAVLRGWADSLLERRRQIRAARTFEELHDVGSEVAADLHGIGALTVYDTATRIGAFLKLEPDRVYLHAGTRDGARALGFGRRDYLLPSELPRAFRRLSPGEIEDCLCIYKRDIPGYPADVIAAYFGTTKAAVYQRLYRLRSQSGRRLPSKLPTAPLCEPMVTRPAVFTG